MNNSKTELETLREENEALRKALHGIETVLDFERQDRVRAEAELAALKYPRAYIPPGGERTEALMALAVSQAEERGALWALERHGHMYNFGLADTTPEEYAKQICQDARVVDSKVRQVKEAIERLSKLQVKP